MGDRPQELAGRGQPVGPALGETSLRVTDAQPCLETVDGDVLPVAEARRVCRRMFYSGFFLLPWMWCVNVWLFWPDFRHGDDVVLVKYTRRSAACFAAASAGLAAWLLTFSLGGPGVVGQDVYAQLNMAGWDLQSLGLIF
ncbi:hypothetical protein WJX81_004587 [Elliptochloris bilobata]|uniref:Gamma-secretase subunit PEN-2 n=1 Tax=Elliptochloris bilobata TaxID=381761 RepID=A0AAW1RH44_9CHLO